MWLERCCALSTFPRNRLVQIFENKGAMMGCSSPHPHGQIWATSYVPAEPAREDVMQAGSWNDDGQLMLLAYAEAEASDGSRTENWNGVGLDTPRGPWVRAPPASNPKPPSRV